MSYAIALVGVFIGGFATGWLAEHLVRHAVRQIRFAIRVWQEMKRQSRLKGDG